MAEAQILFPNQNTCSSVVGTSEKLNFFIHIGKSIKFIDYKS